MAATTERAILAGGCFWGMQELVRRLPGVVSTRVGYSGGDVTNATYRNHGTHAEAIEIIVRPESDRASATCWSSSSRSTTRRRSTGRETTGAQATGRRFSTRARSRRRVAEDTIADVEASGLWPGKVVTEALARRRFLGGRARAPGLPGTLSERLHLPLRPPALEVAAEERRLTATAVSVACGGAASRRVH